MKTSPLSALILAAGKGTRMRSDLAKVLHPLCGRPLLAYVLDSARAVGADRIVVIVGYQADRVREQFAAERVVFVEQREQLGTGHAVLQAREAFREVDGPVLILCGDVPLLRTSTLAALIADHNAHQAAVTVMTVVLEDPGMYGRVIKDASGAVQKIVEAKDATEAERLVGEINTGIYCVESRFLFDAVGRISNANAQGEYYLTDIMEIARRDGLVARAFVVSDPLEVMGINTPDDLRLAACVQEGRRTR
jgi:UDP-N-acetylglucosamine diphosphorylase/glucosamine-1-phosphate N-acetyltransferase